MIRHIATSILQLAKDFSLSTELLHSTAQASQLGDCSKSKNPQYANVGFQHDSHPSLQLKRDTARKHHAKLDAYAPIKLRVLS